MRQSAPAAWQTAILVCGKCSKRQCGGFGPKGRTALVKLLRRLMAKDSKRRQPFGVIETRCLGLCPKNAVVAIDTRRPGEWLLVRPGTPIADIAARLGLDAIDLGAQAAGQSPAEVPPCDSSPLSPS